MRREKRGLGGKEEWERKKEKLEMERRKREKCGCDLERCGR